MKANLGFLRKKLNCLVGGLAIGLIGMSSAMASTYQWKGTASSDWTNVNNWSATGFAAGPAPTNGSFGHRLNVTNLAAGFECVYDASMGTTAYGSNGVRGLVVGVGNFRITGGTFATTNAASRDVIGSGASSTQSTLTNDGGVFISWLLELGGNNPNNGTLTLNAGSTTISNLQYNFQNGRATVSLNGGTFTIWKTTQISPTPLNSVNTFLFNGGTLVAGGSGFSVAAPNTNASSGYFVRDGGAKIDTAGFNITFAQPLKHSVLGGDAAIDGGLTKLGAGTLTSTGTNNYTGPTAVRQGTLSLPLPQSSSALTLSSGAALSLNISNAAWSMATAALTNGILNLNYGSWAVNSYTGAVFNVTNLTLVSPTTFNISGVGFPVTNLTLLTYGSKSGGGSFALGTLPSGMVANLLDDGSNVVLQVTSPSVQNLVWTGGDGIWQTNGALVWNSGTATYLEYLSGNNDLVTFNDNSSGTVNIGSVVKPGLVTVDVTGSFYTFSGSGKISGATSLAKTGTSTLTILSTNDFTGLTTVSGGTLFVGNASALGATNGGTAVSGGGTLEIGTPTGAGVIVSGETASISGTGVGGTLGALRGTATSSGSNVWAGPVVIAANSARIGVENSGNLTVAGNITDNGANFEVVFRSASAASLTIIGTNNTWGGQSSMLGSDTSSLNILGVDNALPTNAVLGVGNCTFDLNGHNQTAAGLTKGFSSAVEANSIVANNGASPATLTLNPKTSQSFLGPIQNSLAALSITKIGTNNQTLGGTLAYTGNTLVNEGQLSLTTVSTMNSPVTVAGGATLAGEAATTGSLTLNANSILSVNASTPGSFTANTINASASPILVRFSTAPATNSATLVLSAAGGITGSAANFQVIGARSGTFYLTNGNTQLMFVAPPAPTLVWKGNNSLNPSFWDVAVTTNWNNTGSPDRFFTGDGVVFDDTASSFTVAVQGSSVAPSGVVFSNTANAYTVSGGAIAGAISLVKNGTNNLTLGAANNYSGGTVINGGTLIVTSDAALGSVPGSPTPGNLNINGGNLNLNFAAGQTSTNRGVDIQAGGASINALSGNFGFGGLVAGIGGLTNLSTTATLITGNNQHTYAGGFTLLPGGAVVPQTTSDGTGPSLTKGPFGTGTLTLAGGSLRASTSGGPYDFGNAVSLTGDATVVNGGLPFTFSGVMTLTGNRKLTQSNPTNGVTISGGIGESVAGSGFTKDGVGTIILSGTNGYTGNTTVSGGSLVLNGNASLTNSPVVTVNSNAVLDISGIAFTSGASQILAGGGTVAGDVVANGTILPGGTNVGTLTFSNNLTIGGNLGFKLNKSLAQSNDVINVVGTLNHSVAGTLTVSNLGPALVVNDKFILFSPALPNGDLLTIVPPAGVTFTNNLAVDGSISVLTVAPLTPPTLNFTNLGGGSLQFSWTGGGNLQTQTNSLNVGLGTNWVDYPGSSPVTVPVNPTNGSVFFRVKQ